MKEKGTYRKRNPALSQNGTRADVSLPNPPAKIRIPILRMNNLIWARYVRRPSAHFRRSMRFRGTTFSGCSGRRGPKRPTAAGAASGPQGQTRHPRKVSSPLPSAPLPNGTGATRLPTITGGCSGRWVQTQAFCAKHLPPSVSDVPAEGRRRVRGEPRLRDHA